MEDFNPPKRVKRELHYGGLHKRDGKKAKTPTTWRLPGELVDKLGEAADLTGLNVTELVENILDSWLHNYLKGRK